MPFIPAAESLADVRFPLGGVDVSCEFERQPPLTTPTGVNVRGYEPGSERGRGGARPGLSKFIGARVDGGAHLVQHLNVVVTADGDGAGLLTAEDLYGTYATADDPSSNGGAGGTRNPGRVVRAGGSGRQPNRKVATRVAAAPDAVGDTGTAKAGGPAQDLTVLANDAYSGTPTLRVLGVDLGTAAVTGTGTGSKVRYTPPDSPNAGGFAHVDYELTASANHGVSTAQAVVSVDADLPPGDYPGTVTAVGLRWDLIMALDGAGGGAFRFGADGPTGGLFVKIDGVDVTNMATLLAAAGMTPVIPGVIYAGSGRLTLTIDGETAANKFDGDLDLA